MAEKDQEIARLKLCADVAWAHGDVAGSDFYLAKIAEQCLQGTGLCPDCGQVSTSEATCTNCGILDTPRP